MATGQGTVTIDFGVGSNEASIAVTGQASILATSKAESFIMGDDTTVDHTAADHQYAPQFFSLTCGTPTVSTGFTIYARSIHKMQGTFSVRWVWAD